MKEAERKRIVAAIVNPLSIAVAAIGAVTVALSGVWWVLPLTLAVWGGVVFAQWRQAARAIPEEPLPTAYARRESVLRELTVRIEKALESSGPTVRGCLPMVPEQVLQVREKVRNLLRRQARIDAYIAETNALFGANELPRLERALAEARTEAAKQKFSSALDNKRSAIEAREDLKASSERIDAELTEIESSLQTTLSRIVSLDTVQDSSETGQGIADDLSDVLVTIESLEQALSEVQDPSHKRLRA